MHGKTCVVCGDYSPLTARNLGVCLKCVREQPKEALAHTSQVHQQSRLPFNLPEKPPDVENGVSCGLCARMCVIQNGDRGYCGLRRVRDGRLEHIAGIPSRGLLNWYRDPLPTNCVADWVCPGHRRFGEHNLAVFYSSCTLNCLFCQNWHYRTADPTRDRQGRVYALSADTLAATANERTFCVCFFGGDPASQMTHSLASGHILADQGLAVCWETAGTMHPKLLRAAIRLSLRSKGCIKFDIKAFNPNLHQALTGSDNRQSLENFQDAASFFTERPSPPLIVASTLLVPGYIDAAEVSAIAGFIADLHPDIPYALLGFFPHFYMDDLPPTSSAHASEALEAAREAGLTNVRLGNVQLLSNAY